MYKISVSWIIDSNFDARKNFGGVYCFYCVLYHYLNMTFTNRKIFKIVYGISLTSIFACNEGAFNLIDFFKKMSQTIILIILKLKKVFFKYIEILKFLVRGHHFIKRFNITNLILV